MAEVAEAPEEVVDLPASEKVHINRMADKFRDAMKATKPEKAIAEVPPAPAKPAAPEKPAAPAPAPAKPAVPAEPPKPAPAAPAAPEPAALPADVKGKAREAFEALEKTMKKYRGDYEAMKPQFESLASEKTALIAERDAIKAERDAAKKGTEEYEALKKQYEDADKIIKQFYIENDPQFQAHFGQLIQSAKLEAVEAVGPEHAEKIKSILEMPPSVRKQQLAPIFESLDEMSRIQLMHALTQLQGSERDRAAELAKSRENHAKLQQVRSKEAQEQAAKAAELDMARRNELLSKVLLQIEPELNGYAEADAIKSAAKRFVFREGGPEDFVSVVSDAARWRRHSASLKEKDELIGKLQAQLAEVQASNPTTQSSGPSTVRKATSPMDNSDIGPIFRKARDGK